MSRAIWKGNISFGLVNIPVNLFSAEKTSAQIRMHLLDKKTNSRIHNQRVNDKGKVVDWEDIERAYEFEKGKYIKVDQKMLEKTAADNYETVEISAFVPFQDISPLYFEKPYYLLPGESGVKGYVLLHDILQRTKKVGIATVVIKTREYLAAILPEGDFLTLIVLRYAKELRSVQEFADQNPLANKKIKIQAREMQLAEQLVNSMSGKWKPNDYRDENKELLLKLIHAEIKHGKAIVDKSKGKVKAHEAKAGKIDKSEKVLDFMELLKKSVAEKEKRKKVHKYKHS